MCADADVQKMQENRKKREDDDTPELDRFQLSE